MKKSTLFLTLLLILFGVSACAQKDETQVDSKETPNVTENEENKVPIVDENEENETPSTIGNEGSENTSTTEEPPNELDAEKQYENDSFKSVIITESNEGIIVKGKARVFEGVFQYAIVSGTEKLLENYYQTDGAPAWGEFKLTFDKNLITKPKTSLELFVYSAKDGSKTSVLTIPLTTK
ncbi:hypothetical protein JMM81_16865 [Bacillus sp. V3B]|uniref:Gmad2 immunoglobulin-like domain-containing protein n=1 Tax=Bacillus sp. V3B TaxID=2804915 RepID=UPI00210D3A8A|nr:Gmad2 immunoglobulin-like domain-containing protein [Bacillus sp. V3B]MCQ6276586.1 hypothetical protein [Bacillus sp. V3B]